MTLTVILVFSNFQEVSAYFSYLTKDDVAFCTDIFYEFYFSDEKLLYFKPLCNDVWAIETEKLIEEFKMFGDF